MNWDKAHTTAGAMMDVAGKANAQAWPREAPHVSTHHLTMFNKMKNTNKKNVAKKKGAKYGAARLRLSKS